MQNLEETIGCPLYEKKDKKSPLVFTLVGEQVVKQGRELLAKGQDLIDLGRYSQGDIMQGKLRLGCIPTIAPFLLCDLVNQVNEDYPQLNLLLKEDTTANLLTALKHGELDVLILALPVDIEGMQSQIVGQDPFKMIISQTHCRDLPRPFRYSDLPDDFVFLLEKEHCLTEHALSACRLTEKEKINPFSATSLHTVVQMVANGMGATFVPQMAIDHGLAMHENLVVIDTPEAEAYRDIGLVWRPNSSQTATFDKLSTLITTIMKRGKVVYEK
ncbi:LysR substrate-binding domain-containing protein [Vibrio sp.]|nr:LysR substrate-binding domain-containing protein [Vibrio sp.]